MPPEDQPDDGDVTVKVLPLVEIALRETIDFIEATYAWTDEAEAAPDWKETRAAMFKSASGVLRRASLAIEACEAERLRAGSWGIRSITSYDRWHAFTYLHSIVSRAAVACNLARGLAVHVQQLEEDGKPTYVVVTTPMPTWRVVASFASLDEARDFIA